MMESERAIQQLVYGVLELAEATRKAASEGIQDLGLLEDLAGKSDHVSRQVACLRALAQTEMSAADPPAPLPRAMEAQPRSEEIVESLDDIFGGF